MINITLNLWFFFTLYVVMLVGMFVLPEWFKWAAYCGSIAWVVFVLIWAVVGGTVHMSTSAENVFGYVQLNGLMSLFNAQ